MMRAAALLILILPLLAWSCGDLPTAGPESASPESALSAKGGTKGKPDNTGSGDDGSTFEVLDLAVTVIGPDWNTTYPATPDPAMQAQVDAYEAAEGLSPDFFGCPDLTRTCNRIELSYSGDMPSFMWSVAHNRRGLLDGGLDNPQRAIGWSNRALPTVSLDGSSPAVFYWQGQRRNATWDGEAYVYGWDIVPDLDAVGAEDDHFAFNYGYDDGAGTSRISGYGAYTNFPGNRARFTGGAGNGALYVVTDRLTLETGNSGRGKKATSWARITFDAQSYDHAGADPTSAAGNVPANHSYRLMRPAGSGELVPSPSIGVNPDDPDKPEVFKESFQSGVLEQAGCYVLDVVGAEANDLPEARLVWDAATDAAGAAAIYITFDPNDVTATTFSSRPCS